MTARRPPAGGGEHGRPFPAPGGEPPAHLVELRAAPHAHPPAHRARGRRAGGAFRPGEPARRARRYPLMFVVSKSKRRRDSEIFVFRNRYRKISDLELRDDLEMSRRIPGNFFEIREIPGLDSKNRKFRNDLVFWITNYGE